MNLKNGVIVGFVLFGIFTMCLCETPENFNDFQYLPCIKGTPITSRDVGFATMASVNNAYFTQYSSNETLGPIHENIPFMTESSLATDPGDVKTVGFTTVDVPDAAAYREWEKNTIPVNYSASLWYFDDASHEFWGNGDSQFQPWETHEEIQVRFDGSEIHEGECLPILQGGNIHVTLNFDPAGMLHDWYTLPGLIYRADNIFAPPMVKINNLYVPFESEIPLNLQTAFIPDPDLVMREELPCFTLFNTRYTVVDAGPVLDINGKTGERGPLHGTPYLITGKPHVNQKLYVRGGDSFQVNEYLVQLDEVSVDHDTATFTVYRDGVWIDTFRIYGDRWFCGFTPNILLLDCKSVGLDPLFSENYHHGDHESKLRPPIPWIDTNKDGKLDAGEYTPEISYDYNDDNILDYHKWISYEASKEIWVHSSWITYRDNHNDSWLLFTTVDFAIDFTRMYIDYDGKIGAELILYWLEDKKIWYDTMCCAPWNKHSEGDDFRIFLDAYQTGWDIVEDNSYAYQPPGTGLWPPAGLETWKNTGLETFVGNGFLDCNDGHCGYECSFLPDGYVLEAHDLDRDYQITNDCRRHDWTLLENCTDIYDIEDPAIVYGPGLVMLEINVFLYNPIRYPKMDPWIIHGPNMDGSPFFTVQAIEISKDAVTYIVVLNDIVGS